MVVVKIMNQKQKPHEIKGGGGGGCEDPSIRRSI